MKISRGQFLASLIGLPLVAKAVLQKQVVRRPLVIDEAGFSKRPAIHPDALTFEKLQEIHRYMRENLWREFEPMEYHGMSYKLAPDPLRFDWPVQKIDGAIEFRSMARVKEVVGPGYRITHIEGFGPF